MVIQYKGRTLNVSDGRLKEYSDYIGGKIDDITIDYFLHVQLDISLDSQLTEHTDEELSRAVEEAIAKDVKDQKEIARLWAQNVGE